MHTELFQKNVVLLSRISDEDRSVMPCNDAPLPSVDALRDIVQLVRNIVFPGFFDRRQVCDEIHSYHIGVYLEQLYDLLRRQIALALLFDSDRCEDSADGEAERLAADFIDRLPAIKKTLRTDVEAIFDDDAAAKSRSEIIFCYPVVTAMLHYRTAHQLYVARIPVLPRIITEMAHALTGIDIHPGAEIGPYFSIDHGTGVVIGETCVIGSHVTLYQGVTLGARNYKLTHSGQPKGQARHPIIGDRVTIYSNTTVLGRVTIGHDTVIGGNIWITHDIAPGSKLLQGKAIDITFNGGLGI